MEVELFYVRICRSLNCGELFLLPLRYPQVMFTVFHKVFTAYGGAQLALSHDASVTTRSFAREMYIRVTYEATMLDIGDSSSTGHHSFQHAHYVVVHLRLCPSRHFNQRSPHGGA